MKSSSSLKLQRGAYQYKCDTFSKTSVHGRPRVDLSLGSSCHQLKSTDKNFYSKICSKMFNTIILQTLGSRGHSRTDFESLVHYASYFRPKRFRNKLNPGTKFNQVHPIRRLEPCGERSYK